MMPLSGPMFALAVVSSFFAITAVFQLAAPAFVERIRVGLGYPVGVFRAAALIQLGAAVFLVIPETRIWGVAAAAGLIAATCVIFFTGGRTVWCLPALLLFGVLCLAALAI